MKNSKYILAGLSVFCVLLIAVTSINSSFLTPLRTGVGYFLVPLQSGMNTVGTSLYNNIRDYSSLKEAQAENARLTQRIDQLTEENNRLQAEQFELERLRELYCLIRTICSMRRWRPALSPKTPATGSRFSGLTKVRPMESKLI